MGTEKKSDQRKERWGRSKTGEIVEKRWAGNSEERSEKKEMGQEKDRRDGRSKTIINHLPFLSSTTSSP